MHSCNSNGADAFVAALAATQHGVFTRRQAEGRGCTRAMIAHRVAAGRWLRVQRNVFVLAGTPPTWRGSLLAACFAWGDDVAASHRAAAVVWSIEGVSQCPPELTVPRDRRRRAPGVIHRGRLEPVDITVRHGIPVTTPARTIIDLAGVLSEDRLEVALDDLLRRRLVTVRRVRRRAQALGKRPGAVTLRRLLQARDGSEPADSSLELRVIRLLREAGLSEPMRQFRVVIGDRVVAALDLAYPDAKLAIEVDGYRYHAGRQRFEHDRARLNMLSLLGWRMLRVTWAAIERRPGLVVANIAQMLGERPLFVDPPMS